MKVLIVTPYYLPYVSGITIYCQRLAKGLSKNGSKVTVMTYKHLRKLKNKEILNGIEVIRVPFLIRFQRGVFSFNFLYKFLKLAKKFDVINLHMPFFEVGALAFFSKMKNKPIVLTYHCDLKIRNGILSLIADGAYKSSLFLASNLANKIVVNSLDYARDSLIKSFSSKIVEVMPPIEKQKLGKVKDLDKFKRKIGISRNDVVVGYMGRITWEKGLEYLIKAIPLVLKEVKNVKFVIAGEAEKIAGGKSEYIKEDLERLASELGVADHLIFSGFIDEKDKSKFYSSCDIFVLPSYDRLESFNFTQVEAALCGCKLVVSDIPGVRTVLHLVRGGILVKPRDSKKIAEAIVKIFRNQKKFSVARSTVTKYFNIERTIDAYEDLIKSVL